jgi:hypothetical protein
VVSSPPVVRRFLLSARAKISLQFHTQTDSRNKALRRDRREPGDGSTETRRIKKGRLWVLGSGRYVWFSFRCWPRLRSPQLRHLEKPANEKDESRQLTIAHASYELRGKFSTLAAVKSSSDIKRTAPERQIFTVVSQPQLATLLLSGLNATASTDSVWPEYVTSSSALSWRTLSKDTPFQPC